MTRGRPAARYRGSHLGYRVEVSRLLPFLWAVDIEWEADRDAGEGPAVFWSWGSPERARRRGLYWVDWNAEILVPTEEDEAATDTERHAGCRPEAEETLCPCLECLTPAGLHCKPTCSTWSNILHVCQEPK